MHIAGLNPVSEKERRCEGRDRAEGGAEQAACKHAALP